MLDIRNANANRKPHSSFFLPLLPPLNAPFFSHYRHIYETRSILLGRLLWDPNSHYYPFAGSTPPYNKYKFTILIQVCPFSTIAIMTLIRIGIFRNWKIQNHCIFYLEFRYFCWIGKSSVFLF